jgi:hypothetical protein
MGALMTSQLFHLGTGDYGVLAIIAPLAGSVGLTFLVFPQLFQPHTPEVVAPTPS